MIWWQELPKSQFDMVARVTKELPKSQFVIEFLNIYDY